MTRVDKIRGILDHGQPLPLESTTESHSPHASGHQKDEPGTRLELHFSPNAVGIAPTNSQHKYSANWHTQYSIGTSFEVYVRRQSLCAAGGSNSNRLNQMLAATTNASSERRSSGSEELMEGCSSSNSLASAGAPTSLRDMTWFTKEAGACVLTALILKLEKINPAAGGAGAAAAGATAVQDKDTH